MDFSRFDPASFSGVDDASVRHFAIPPYGFVHNWMKYAEPLTEAPLVYHLVVGLSLVSVTVPSHIFLPDGDDLRANVFGMLVGPSSRGRKTFCVELGSKLLMETAPLLFMSDDGSTEGFADAIIPNPRRLIVSVEGGQFLAHSVGGKYGHELRKRLTALYDCSPLQRNTASKIKAKENFIQPDPRVSMLMACTKSDLETYTMLPDWTGGYLSRYCMVWAAPQRALPRAGRDQLGRDAMKTHLFNLSSVISVGPVGGQACVGMTPEAADYFDAWQRQIPKGLPEKAMGSVDRAQIHARKAALVLAYDRHTYAWCSSPETVSPSVLERPFQVDLPDVRVGCALGTFHIASALHLISNISATEDGRMMRQVCNYLQERGGLVSRVDVLRHIDVRLKVADAILATLVELDYIGLGQDYKSYYLKTPGAEALVAPSPGQDPFTRVKH